MRARDILNPHSKALRYKRFKVTKVPVTPLHYSVAYVLSRVSKKLVLPGLVVGSMFPDLEIPIIILLLGTRVPHRLVLHSLLGAATVGSVLSAMFTVWCYPPLVSTLFGVDKARVERKCKSTVALGLSVVLGNISHVLLDVTNHPYNPVLWPFSPTPFNAVYMALGGLYNASLIVHIVLFIIGGAVFFAHRGIVWEKLLVNG